MRKVIQVWPYCDAPIEYRQLSCWGGDEDWVALIPYEYNESQIPWLASGGLFGSRGVSRHKTDKGYVYIGAHA